MPRLRLRLGRPTRQDAVAGFVTGLFSIPEGMAYASIGGFNPALGLYSGMVPTAVGGLFARTVLMTTTLTSAIALTSKSVLEEAGLDPSDAHVVATLTLLTGTVMAVFGLLRLGAAMSFVSNAVMTGFTTGIALQILAGVVKDATGYTPTSHNTLGKLAGAIVHVGSWDGASVVVATATVVVWAGAHAVRQLRTVATLVALVVVSVAVTLLDAGVEKVADIGSVPAGLPLPTTPDLTVVPHLLVGAVAVALVALAQAAGIGAAVPNPDGSRTDVSGDFTAQGLANLTGGWFQALPTGGSLSRTGVATSAGARTRWTAVFAGLLLAVMVLLAGPVAEQIPMPVIGGLILVIGGELVVGRWPDILLVARTGALPTAVMATTFLATTQLPLQQAIMIGAVLSLLVFCVQAAGQARLQAIARDRNGRWHVTPVPDRVGTGEVVVLDYRGAGLFAEVSRLEESWPDLSAARASVVIIHARGVPDVPSSTIVKALVRRNRQLALGGCRLMVAGVSSHMAAVLDRTGLSAELGRDNVYERRPAFFESLDLAYDTALAWVARGAPDDHATPSPSEPLRATHDGGAEGDPLGPDR